MGVAAGIFALRGEEPTPPQVAELTSEALAPPKLAAPVASIVPAQVDAKPAAREIPLPPAKKAARAAEQAPLSTAPLPPDFAEFAKLLG